MSILDTVKSSFSDRLTSGQSIQNSLFKQVAADAAKTTVGASSKTAQSTYENKTQIYLTNPQTQKNLQLPVLPSKIALKWDRQIETVNIMSLGEVDFTTGRKLQEISFSSFFPSEYTSAYCRYAAIPTPSEAYSTLDSWCAAKDSDEVPAQPVRLQIVGHALDINMLVLISSLEIEDRGGEPGDLYYSISCRQWREIKVRTANEQRVTNNRSNTKPIVKTILEKATTGEPTREFLYKLAKQYYGNGGNWTKLLELNKEKLQGDLTKKAVSLVLR